MNIIGEAEKSIEAWVAQHRLGDKSLKWLGRTPASDWHYAETAWSNEFSTIIADFERRIGYSINVKSFEKRSSTGKFMRTNWFFLVRKAEISGTTTIIQEMTK